MVYYTVSVHAWGDTTVQWVHMGLQRSLQSQPLMLKHPYSCIPSSFLSLTISSLLHHFKLHLSTLLSSYTLTFSFCFAPLSFHPPPTPSCHHSITPFLHPPTRQHPSIPLYFQSSGWVVFVHWQPLQTALSSLLNREDVMMIIIAAALCRKVFLCSSASQQAHREEVPRSTCFYCTMSSSCCSGKPCKSSVSLYSWDVCGSSTMGRNRDRLSSEAVFSQVLS